ncbi:unnamed protein product, partial [Discosporangium mesarthrocarpum]
MKSDNESCSICLSVPTNRGVIPCGHGFCFACILTWSKTENTCPLCKGRFTTIVKH